MLALLLHLACFALCQAACPTNTFPGLTDKDCYWPLIWSEKSWADAEATCAKFGGHLASVGNVQDNDFIARLMNKRASEVPRYWLGGRDDVNGTWSWSDGRPFSYANWASGNPAEQAGLCTTSASYGRLSQYCGRKQPFVCKIPALPASRCAPGFDFVEDAKLCVKLISKSHYWNSKLCASESNSTLASIHSDAANHALAEYLNGRSASLKGFSHVWIGLQYYPSWSDGSKYDYQNWDYPDQLKKCSLFNPRCGAAIQYGKGENFGKWVWYQVDWSSRPALCAKAPLY